MADEPVDVLLVEDSEVAAALALHALRAEGWRVERLADGAEAARVLSDGGALPRVVVLDWELPGADAPGILERLVQAGTRERMRVVGLTSHDRDRVLGAGADGYVPKPFAAEHLVAEIRRVLAGPTWH
ncbi:MAG TPA: response regulator [Baekduia sp.]|nr:response regulator [Baekduia sp.]